MSKVSKTMFQIETAYAASGKISVTEITSEVEAYRARVDEGDARKAEAFLQVNPKMNVLEKIRILLRRGDFENVDVELSSLHKENPDSEMLAEIFLEQARLSVYEGQWSAGVQMAQKAFSLAPSGVSQMALHQVCANAIYELGDFDLALTHIEKAQSLARLFPHGGLATYLEATQIKILIRQEKFSLAEQQLRRLWKSAVASGRLNADIFLTLLRLKVDLRRSTGQTYEASAFACWMLSRAMGDQLYADLAALDLYFLHPAHESRWRAEVGFAIGRYKRVQGLFEQVEKKLPTSSSARSLLQGERTQSSTFSPDAAESVSQIFLLNDGVSLNLETLKVTMLPQFDQILKSLKILSTGPKLKKDFFQSLWGEQKFSAHLHSPVISSLLYRLRKLTSIEIQIRESTIETHGTLLVDE